MLACTFFIFVEITAAVRYDAMQIEMLLNETETADDGCLTKCKPGEAAGHYEVHGKAALQLSRPLQQFFIDTTCAQFPTNVIASSNVVPWLVDEDPINKSFVAVYIDPVLENTLQNEAKLCVRRSPAESSTCVCKLSGRKGRKTLDVVGRLAALLPMARRSKLLAVERRCPAGLPDVVAAGILILLVLVVVIGVDAAVRACRASPNADEVPVQHDPKNLEVLEGFKSSVLSKTPMQNFTSSYSWSAGFVMSLAALQTGALSFVQKSSDVEAHVWFVAVFPAILAVAVAIRLMNLLCKKQLTSAFWDHGCVLTDPIDSSYLDLMLLAMLALYSLVILCLVSSSLQGLMVALVALSGSSWALLKSVQVANEMDKLLPFIQVNWEHFAQAEKPKIKFIPWRSLLSACRGNQLKKLLSASAEPSDPSTSSSFPSDPSSTGFKLTDIIWHGRTILYLTNSKAAFLVFPSLVALVALSLGISSVQLASYACSRGELANLTLATSEHSLIFEPWQQKYEVILDTSFRQVAMVASFQPDQVRWINFTQPLSGQGVTADPVHIPIEATSSAVAEIKLSQKWVPRISRVDVKGLRPSLNSTSYQVRFSPAMTMPLLLRITAGDFETRVAWSTLPGSVISVPNDPGNLSLQMNLVEFALGIPVAKGDSSAPGTLWTEFEPGKPSESSCSKSCSHSLDCFDFFLGRQGCFYARGNHSHLESESNAFILGKQENRKLTGHLIGCKLEESGAQTGQCAQPADAEGHVLKFPNINPDWQGMSATLTFSLVLEVGEQSFRSEFGSIQLQRGLPEPFNGMGVLVGERIGGTGLSSDGSKDIVLASEIFMKKNQLVVNISEFDPKNFSKLRLSVMPMLPDRAFKVAWSSSVGKGWSSEASSLDLEYMKDTPKCRTSGLVKTRYEVCGAAEGIQDRPITIHLSPWTGRLEEGQVSFQVVPKEQVQKANHWPKTEKYHLSILFDGVDSPAAWAAKKHGCDLLEDAHTKETMLASADALCQLMHQCDPKVVCGQISEEAMGQSMTKAPIPKFAPLIEDDDEDDDEDDNFEIMKKSLLLTPQGIVKVMACMAKDQVCKKEVKNEWSYDEKQGLLKLKGHMASLTPDVLLEQLVQLEEEGLQGATFLKSMNISASTENSKLALYRELAKLAWEFSQPFLWATMSSWKEAMPKIMIDALIKSNKVLALPEGAELEKLQAAFNTVTRIVADFQDAVQLDQLRAALRLAPGVVKLDIDCHKCSEQGKKPAPEQLSGLFHTASNVTRLDLHNFNIGDLLQPNTFEGLGKLEKLYLHENQLSNLPEKVFKGLGNLERLDLQNNQLSNLTEKVFEGLNELKELDLQNNQLSNLTEKVFEGLNKLKWLDLQNNQLSNLTEKVFEGLANLERLDLQNNQLSNLTEKVFEGLSKLEWLGLRENQLSSLPEKVFKGLKKLKWLGLHENQLSSLPEKVFEGLNKLEWLDLSYNELSNLTEKVFEGLNELKELDLQTNQLSNLTEKVFEGLNKLEKLFLYKNQLSNLPEKVFEGLNELRVLLLENNQLSNLPEKVFKGLGKLDTLSLKNNQLSNLPEKVFKGLGNLERLGLSYNQLSNLTEKAFEGLGNLKESYLNGNKLSSASRKALESLQHMRPQIHLKI